MIFVTLGTFPASFIRPLEALHYACEKGILKQDIIVQSGYTEFDSDYLNLKPFLTPERLDYLTRHSELIITHAGSGSMIKAIKYRKKIIAIPRLAKYGEVVDDHQLEILEVFAEKGYVLPWYEKDSLQSLLKKVEGFEPNEYVSKKQVIMDYLENYINSI